jgi:type II secretory pathway pseudopilin PulG
MPSHRDETRRPARDAGLTLVEMLVMLVIAGVVAAISIESIRIASGNGIRVSRAALEATGGLIDRAALRSAIEASQSDYSDSDRRFQGGPDGFSSLTYAPLSGRLGEPQGYTLEFEPAPSDGSLQLVYSDGHGEIVVGQWPEASGSFEYYVEADPSDAALTFRPGSPSINREREWVDTWPNDRLTDVGYYVRLPLAVKIEIQPQSGETVAMIVRFPITAPPPLRAQDVTGADIP